MYNTKKELKYHLTEFDILNFLIQVIIKLNNKFYKSIIKIYYTNSNNKTRLYKKYTSYFSRKL